VVFVTAFDEFAVPAFEVHAIDYLLKPFDRERLQKALARVRQALAPQEAAAGGETEAKSQYLERLAVKSVGKTEFVATAAIDWIDTAGNYLCVHAGGETHLVRETMAQLEASLDPHKFVRIHRSTMVKIDRIKAVQSLGSGDQIVTLTNGARLTLSRSYRKKLGALLGG
jgi:two-component system LytT family response regulator